jgi:hypothetical protein
MLKVHDEYPITQIQESKLSSRTMTFICGGLDFDYLVQAIRHQAVLEGKPRPELTVKKGKKVRK